MKIFTYLFLSILLLGISFTCSASTLENVLKTGTLNIGVSLFEPWVVKNEKGDLDGYEVQIAKQLAEDLGVTPKFKIVDWEELINELENNKIDIIIAGMAITPERALRINFSNPYSSSGISIAACIAQTKNMESLDELNDSKVTIGAVSNTVSEELAKRYFNKAKLKSFTKSEDAINAVLEGEIHALVESSPVPKFLAMKHPDQVDVPLSKPLLSYKTGMAVNKGEQEFLNYLNAWITSREAEGWLPAKHKYWFESLDWKKD
ncbi:MAG: transporter substrate-binding domain-containing protein [Gammaproteobacteria bacterium]